MAFRVVAWDSAEQLFLLLNNGFWEICDSSVGAHWEFSYIIANAQKEGCCSLIELCTQRESKRE
jgi:hypothetical protein